MELNLDTGKLIVFVAGLLIFLGLETIAPARPHIHRLRRIGFHGGVAVLNTVTIRLFAYVPFLLWLVHVEEEGWGISRWLGLVGWAEILLSLVVLDFFDYLWHRANHRVRWLWRFHKAHHADTAMDVTTALRFHPGELLISAGIKALWVVIWGPTVVAWFLFEALVSFCAQFHHSNIDFPDWIERWLAWFIVTPRFHASHHAVDRRTGNANFSTIFSLWDVIFTSYARPPGRTARRSEPLGLPEARALAFSALAWIDEPFRRRNLEIDNR
ncbi:MAG: sterol desaturase family protein [Proteobacteria bacterium]|nr:sterol desaturase family protein [Pseudomonadota bacterium]